MLDQYTDLPVGSTIDVVDRIETMAAEGILQPGDRLPTIRHLAESVSVSANTVAAAYRRLATRGTVVTQGRRGTFVADRPGVPHPDPPVPAGMIDLASGNPDPSLLPDLDRYVRTVCTTKILYGEPPVDARLEPIARRLLTESGIPVGTLAVVGGALDGVERALQTHLRIGDAVAVEAPGWPAFHDLVSAMGMRPVPVPVDDRGMIPHRLAEVVGMVAAVVITPRAQNPTGAAVDAGRASELRSVLAERTDILVIEDDHGGLISGVDLASVGAGRKRWALVQSVSKSLGPDLRLAYLTGDDRTVGMILGRQSAGPGWVSHVLQKLVAAVLADPATEELLDRATMAYHRRRQELISELAALGVKATGRTGLNVWANVPDEEATVAALASAGYVVRSGRRWRMGAAPAVRVSIGMMETEQAVDIARVIAGTVAGSPPDPPRRTGRLA